MNKSYWNLRNFKKGLKHVERIAKQSDLRAVDYACGYAIATIDTMQKSGKITKKQKDALVDLAFSTADDTAADITDDCADRYEDGSAIDWDIEPPTAYEAAGAKA